MPSAGARRTVDRPPTIVIADPPNPPSNPYVSAFPNLAALYLAAAVKRHISHASVHYLDHRLSWREHLAQVRALKPDVYGLSFASPFARIATHLLADVRATAPDTRIVCGGPHPTIAAREVLMNTAADCCCLGEGEVTFPELVNAWTRRTDLQEVPGIAFRDSRGGVVYSAKRQPVQPVDDIPSPDFTLVDLTSFTGLRMAMNQPSTAIVASRGCPWNCTFCSNPVWRHHTPRVRLHSPERIVREVDELYGLGIREIYIRSDEMNADLGWAEEVFERLASLGRHDLYFQCNVRARPMTEKLATLMRRANCWECHIGLESASNRVLKGIQKNIVRDDFEECVRLLNRAGVKVYAFMMMYNIWEENDRLQVETSREVLGSIRFILEMRARGLVDRMSWGYATPYPGAEMQRVCDKYNLQLPTHSDDSVSGPDQISMQLPGIRPREMVAVRVLGLFAQSVLAGTTRQFWKGRNPVQTMRHAAFKAGRLLGGSRNVRAA